MSTWLVNDQSPESLGLTLVGGEFRSGSASSLQLDCTCDFDASEILAYGDAVTVKRDDVKFFQGTVRKVPKHGAADDEGHSYIIADAWDELERTIYQQLWYTQGGSYLSPQLVLGMNAAGDRITVGAEISGIIAFAATAGINIQAGSIPTGMTLWPSEASGLTCAQVIRDALRFYPDWIPWIDHSTTIPTFNVTPRASATARSLAVTDCTSFGVTKTQDRVPDCVRIVYLTATMIDDEVYRDGVVDKWPAEGADSGPGVLTTLVPLAGLQMQIEKQQVQTRTIPADASTAKAYLKKKFPSIAAIDDANFTITDWSKSLVTETDEAVDPIDEKLERKLATDIAQTPRELVRGTVTEWMQKRVGWVAIKFTLTVESGATEAEAATLQKLDTEFAVIGTNAITKVYKGVSSYEAGEDAPAGIAQAYYETIAAGCYFEGSATIREDDVGATRWHGSKLNLTGGVTEWSTMAAPIHSVTWDIASQTVTIGFGPNPDYAVQDFLEFLKLLNKRPHTSYTLAERSGNTLGSTTGVSARGDSVGPFDSPATASLGGSGGGGTTAGAFYSIAVAGDGHTYLQGGSITGGIGIESAANIKIIDSGTGVTQSAGVHMYVIATGDGVTADGVLLPGFNLTAASIGYNATIPDNTLPTAASATGRICHIDLGVFTSTGFTPAGAGNFHVSSCPGSYTVSRA